MAIRRAAVAGSYYPRFKPDLIRIIEKSFSDKKFGPSEEFKTLNIEERTVIGGVSPDAPYISSGFASAHTFLNLFKEKIPDTIIILGSDHLGYDKNALIKEGEWETPLGNLSIDKKIAEDILKVSKIIINDEAAFFGFPYGREYSIEVQLPFIKYCSHKKGVEIVPIKITTEDFTQLDRLSSDIASVINSQKKDVIIIASAVMNSIEIHKSNADLKKIRMLDQNIIDNFIKFDPKKTFDAASKTKLSGFQTVILLMLICKQLNAKQCKSLKDYTSYDVSKNIEQAVGYFAGIITK